MELTDADKKALQGRGYICYKDGVHFSCRVIIAGGKMNAQESRKITEISETYGRGYFTLTQRMNVEIPWIQYKDIENVARELEEVGLAIGGTGPRVRPALTCKGTVCKFSLMDTEEVARVIDERFYKGQYDSLLPNKFRITLSGCGIGCSKPYLSCLGLQGRTRDKVAIIVGGRHGKDHVVYSGRELPGLYTVGDALDIVEKAISFFRENGNQGERFANMVERIGFETLEGFLNEV